MGIERHDAVIVVIPGSVMRGEWRDVPVPDVEAFRSSLPSDWGQLVVGPIQSVVNDYVTYAFMPDGSKEGWDADADGDQHRDAFRALFALTFEDGSSPFSGAAIRWGGTGPDDSDPDTICTLAAFPAYDTEDED